MTAVPTNILKTFRYPEEIRDDFIKTDDIEFRDGSRVSAAEVWDYLTKVGPVKFPNLYDNSSLYRQRISHDVTLPFTLKHNYLLMTLHDGDVPPAVEICSAGVAG